MNDETENGDLIFTGRQGIKLTHRCFDCTVCTKEHGIFIPVDDVEGYDRAIGQLMKQEICPCGYGQECSVSDEDGAMCGGEVENLEDYNWINGEVYPLFTCARHQGYFIENSQD